MNSSSEMMVTTSRMVATAAATPSLPCTTEVQTVSVRVSVFTLYRMMAVDSSVMMVI